MSKPNFATNKQSKQTIRFCPSEEGETRTNQDLSFSKKMNNRRDEQFEVCKRLLYPGHFPFSKKMF